MAKDKCIDLVAQALKRGNVNQEQAADIIDNIRKNGQNHGRNNLSSRAKYNMLKTLIINSD
jgi:polyhydroxyalkanoate synthesis regulator phasin